MNRVFAFAVLSALSVNGADASKLSDCYDLVIDSCNQGSHPVPCAESGMDQCDEVHSNAVISPKPVFKAPSPKPRPPKAFAVKRAR